MQFEEKQIVYPPTYSGCEKTAIRFYSGEPDLNSIFYPAESEKSPLASQLSRERRKRVFVTDTTVASLDSTKSFVSLFDQANSSKSNEAFKAERDSVLKRDGDILVILGAGEEFKTIESVLMIIKSALEADMQRSSIFVGIGGGVITDLTAFAASIFKRGVKCELVPTTLLAMVDAAIGGKTGCDFDQYKNMIGTFSPAHMIHVCPAFIKSLPEREYRSGTAEVVKAALLYEPALFGELESYPQILRDRENPLVEEMIKVSVNAKAKIVEKDLTEKNIRMHLNLGHTFAHALESCAGLGTVAHGDAVAWGIARAADLALNRGICASRYAKRVKKMLKSFGWETDAIHSAMKEKYPLASNDELADMLISAMKKDKKNASERIRFILQEDIGRPVISEVEDEFIKNALLPHEN